APLERERILRTVKLAQEIGAKTAILAGSDPATTIAEYAHTHNCSKIVVGRRRRSHTCPWTRLVATRIGDFAPDVDVIEIGRGETARPPRPVADKGIDVTVDPRRVAKRLSYVWTLLACVATTLVASPLHAYFDLANIVMLFLLVVVVVAVRFGRGPAVMAAFLSVASFDYFFVEPRFSFAVSDVQYLFTFAVMLAVALVIGQMTAGLRYQARVASYREDRARVLYEFARDMSSVLQTEQVVEAATKFIESTFGAKAAILIPGDNELLTMHDGNAISRGIDLRGAAQWT